MEAVSLTRASAADEDEDVMHHDALGLVMWIAGVKQHTLGGCFAAVVVCGLASCSRCGSYYAWLYCFDFRSVASMRARMMMVRQMMPISILTKSVSASGSPIFRWVNATGITVSFDSNRN